jgi:NADP-reducing hydrogenase subunit HndB
MSKIKSLKDLNKIRDEKQHELQSLKKGESDDSQVLVKVAMATCGIAAGAKETMEFMSGALEKRGVNAIVTSVGCMGYCYAEPTIEVTVPGKESLVFGEVDREKADEIIEKYIKGGEPVDGIIPVNYETIENTAAK